MTKIMIQNQFKMVFNLIFIFILILGTGYIDYTLVNYMHKKCLFNKKNI
jgi:hypothetical protein